MKRHKKLSSEEALTYIACGVLYMDCEDGFSGDITCAYSEDGDGFDVYVTEDQASKTINVKPNMALN